MNIKHNRPTTQVPPLSDLLPKKNCKLCGGRGTLAYYPEHVLASKYRVIRPCVCVKKTIEWENG